MVRVLFRKEDGWFKFRTEDKSIGYECAVDTFGEAVEKLKFRYNLKEVEVVREIDGKVMKLPRAIRKVQIKEFAFPIEGIYNYDAQVITSVDGGYTFWHCGEGKFCKTKEEAEAYKEEVENGD